MLDDLDRLRSNGNLLALLAHYANLAEPDRTVWQDRLMAMEGVQANELTRLHGELIAFSWVDQNTGNTNEVRAGAVLACYRVTPAGLRAVQQVEKAGVAVSEDDEVSLPVADDQVVVAKGRKRRETKPKADQEEEKEAA